MLNDDKIREIVDNFGQFMSDLDALILLTREATELQESRISALNTTLKTIIEDNFSADEFESLYNEHRDTFKKQFLYTHQFDHLFYNSVYITSYSLFEQHLSALGKICETLEITPLRVRDIKGDGIVGTIRKYLNLVFKINSASASEKLWKDITEFRGIRNAIVHNENKLNPNGSIKNTNQIKGYSKLIQHNLDHNGDEVSFKINKIDFLDDFRDTAEKYVGMVTKELIQNYR